MLTCVNFFWQFENFYDWKSNIPVRNTFSEISFDEINMEMILPSAHNATKNTTYVLT